MVDSFVLANARSANSEQMRAIGNPMIGIGSWLLLDLAYE